MSPKTTNWLGTSEERTTSVVSLRLVHSCKNYYLVCTNSASQW